MTSSLVQAQVPTQPGTLLSSGRWIAANIVAAVAMVVAWLAAVGVRELVGTDTGGTILYYTLTAVLFGIAGLIAGAATGIALRSLIAALPIRMWILLHVVLYALPSLADLISPSSPSSDSTAFSTLEIFSIVPLVGAVFGLVTGGLQALVLRRAAYGTKAWILWSAIGGGAGLLVVTWIDANYLNDPSAPEWASAAAFPTWDIITALFLLPALRSLRPRERAEPIPVASSP
jgi:uncharacterized membrane protein